MSIRYFTPQEIDTLRAMGPKLGLQGCAQLLGRTPQSIKNAGWRYRVSFRTDTQQRRGKFLGQPRDVAFSEMPKAWQELALAQQEGDDELVRRQQELRDNAFPMKRQPICVECKTRPVTTYRNMKLCDGCFESRFE
jgi:hypothetical protein